MHAVAMFYPDFPDADDMSHARNFYLSLQGLLPCASCSEHYTQLLLRFPIEPVLHSKMELMRWVWTIHDEVNKRTGKTGPTFAEYLSTVQYEKGSERGIDPLLWGVVIAAVLVVFIRTAIAR